MHFFFFNDTATTEIYTLSLHDALPISRSAAIPSIVKERELVTANAISSVTWSAMLTLGAAFGGPVTADRKSTRLNSSHANISYAVFCLKKKSHSLSHGAVCFTVVSVRS